MSISAAPRPAPGDRPARLLDEQERDGILRQDLMVPMRDGTELATLLFRPADAESSPTLLTRTPYGIHGLMGGDASGPVVAAAGYAVIYQDVRGAHGSQGQYALAANDRDDAEDTIDWAIAQPWSDRTVGITGSSAPGMTAWLAAATGHPAVKTVVIGQTGRAFDGFTYYARGVIQPDTLFGWAANQLLPDQLDRTGATVADPDVRELINTDSTDLFLALLALGDGEDARRGELLAQMGQAVQAKRDANLRLAQRPAEATALLGEHLPWVAQWAAHPDPTDAFWDTVDYPDVLQHLAVPGLHTVGWHDLFVRGTIRNYLTVAAASSAPQRLIVSPYTHLGAAAPVGEWTPPPAAAPDAIAPGGISYAPEPDLTTSWFGHYLHGEDNGIETAAPISLYVQRANTWRHEWEWPLARTVWTDLHLSAPTAANSVRGGGRLTDAPDTAGSLDRFRYDPADPVPSAGGTFLGIIWAPGIVDQQPVEDRDDVLVYTSLPYPDGLEVTGPVHVELYVATTAADTDFTAKLTDVDPHGRSTNVCDGVTRLRFRPEAPGLVEPGSVQKVSIELSPTSYLFQPGHAVRLQIASSNFPLQLNNSNTGRNEATETVTPVTAEQTVYHDPDHPSRLILPVIDN